MRKGSLRVFVVEVVAVVVVAVVGGEEAVHISKKDGVQMIAFEVDIVGIVVAVVEGRVVVGYDAGPVETVHHRPVVVAATRGGYRGGLRGKERSDKPEQ